MKPEIKAVVKPFENITKEELELLLNTHFDEGYLIQSQKFVFSVKSGVMTFTGVYVFVKQEHGYLADYSEIEFQQENN